MAELKVNVTNLVKNYGSNHVLKGIDFKVADNEVVVLIGPSGSGKSTLLRCLNKLEEPTSGTIVIDGQDISDSKTDIDKARENIGMVFQHFNLFNNLSVSKILRWHLLNLAKCLRRKQKNRHGIFLKLLVWQISLMQCQPRFQADKSSALQLLVLWQ